MERIHLVVRLLFGSFMLLVASRDESKITEKDLMAFLHRNQVLSTGVSQQEEQKGPIHRSYPNTNILLY